MPLRRSSWCRRPYSGCTWSRGRSGATSRRRSNAASSTLRTVAQSSPAVAARPTYLVTTPLEIPSAAAICWCDILASSFKRNTSFILRILILGTGTLSPDKCWERTRSVAICVTSFRCCTTPFRYRDRRFRHRDRRFRWRPKSVTIDRNGWSRWTGMTGHDRPESLVTIDRNTQLGTIERIERALALYLVVAWRIAHLMRMGRTCPDLDAKLFFDPDEIQAAYLLNKALAPPAPRLNEVVRMIARVGGFLARKSDGEPGAKTIWEGLRDVRASAHTIKTLREMGLLSSCV